MNSNYSDNKQTILRILVICSLIVSFISFFMPFVSVRLLFAKDTYSGYRLIKEILDDGEFLGQIIILSPVCTVICLVITLVKPRAKVRSILVAVITAIGIIVMLIAFSSDFFRYVSISEIADTGLNLYIASSIGAIIFSLIEWYFLNKIG